jgi:methylmalonyl-CoA/ethylmalonyl-CoA epimerase
MAAHRRLRLGREGVEVHEDARGDLDRLGVAPRALRRLAHHRHRLRHVLGREPVEDDAVGDLARHTQHPGPERGHVDGHRPGRRLGEPEAVHLERLALEHHPLAGQGLAQEQHHLAHASGRLVEAPAVPLLDDDLRAGAQPEDEAAGRDVGHAGGRLGERGRPARVDIGDGGAEPEPRARADDGQRREAIEAVGLERPGIRIAPGLRLARERDVLGEREAILGHRQRPARLGHAFLRRGCERVAIRVESPHSLADMASPMMGDVIELTVVVKDLDAAVERYGRLYGLREHHRLESKEFGFKSAILPLGAGHIELLQPTDPDKPAGRFLARNGEGVYLVGFETKDVAAAAEHLKKQGVKVDQRGDKIAWVHPRESHGLFVELRKRESYD